MMFCMSKWLNGPSLEHFRLLDQISENGLQILLVSPPVPKLPKLHHRYHICYPQLLGPEILDIGPSLEQNRLLLFKRRKMTYSTSEYDSVVVKYA